MKLFRNFIIGLLLIASIGAVFYALIDKGYLRFNYPAHKNFPVQGIDVSHHQGEIDWKKVKAANIEFAFIKATEGGDFIDKRFLKNWEEASAQNIDVGAYHFYRFCKSGEEQAQNFISIVPKLANSLPPVIDLEFGANCAFTSKENLLREIDIMQKKLSEYYNSEVIFYATTDFYEQFLMNKFPDNPIWIRDIFKEPTLADNRQWTFWQYANRGHVDGIKGYVDLNVFYGDEIDTFKNLAPNGSFGF